RIDIIGSLLRLRLLRLEPFDPHDPTGAEPANDRMTERVADDAADVVGNERLPEDRSGRVQIMKRPLDRGGGDSSAHEAGRDLRHRSAELIRADLRSTSVMALDAVRVARQQNRLPVPRERKIADVGEELLLPERLSIEVVAAEHAVLRDRQQRGLMN